MTDATSPTPDPAPPAGLSPAQAFADLRTGNERFVQGRSSNGDQDGARRAELAGGQHPFAVVLGCSDSRVPPELVFDQGLGRLFVVRNAGHVVDAAVLGSVEYGVGVLRTPLVVVLGHEACGAVRAGLDGVATGEMPAGFVRDLVERVTPSVLAAQRANDAAAGTAEAVEAAGAADLGEAAEAVEVEHVRQTVRLLLARSTTLADAVESGRVAVVGLRYRLVAGEVSVIEVAGSVSG